ncbi:MAG TPA: TraC family protein, partial [Planctomycetota bacterium]|nr:TraC family protein [Planctomycetota bacterium]
MSRSTFAPLDHDVASFTGFLPYHSVDPQGNVVLLADSSSGVPEWMGIVWRLTPVDTEVFSPDALGMLAGRLERLVEALPEGTAAQMLLRTRKDIRADLDGWLKATRSSSTLLRELAASRAQALSTLSIIGEQTSYTSRSIEILFTIARKGNWSHGDAGLLETLGDTVANSEADLSPL